MFIPQRLLKALRRVLRGDARGRSPLKAILFLSRFFRRLFQCFSRTRDDGAPDKRPQCIVDQALHLPEGVEPTKSTMLLAVDGNADEPVPAVVCRSAALPNNPRSSHDIALVSVASRSQTGLAFETDLNPSNGHPPLHGSRLSSMTLSSIESSLSSSARSSFSQSSQGIYVSRTAYSSAADPHLDSLHVHLPHTNSEQGGLLFDSVAAASPQLPTAAQRDGQNQYGVPNSTLHDVYPYITTITPEALGTSWGRLGKPRDPNAPPIAPLTTSFYLDGVPSGWSLHVRPLGVRYYVFERMFHALVNTLLTPSMPCTSLLRVFTEVDVVISEDLQVLIEFLDSIVSYMHTKGITLSPKVDLVLDLTWYGSDTASCSYYFADHEQRSIFWLDSFDANSPSHVSWWNASEPSHLAHAIEAEYWHHCYLFPVCREMTSDTIEEVSDFIIDCITGTLETSYARYGYTLPELQQYLSITTSIINNPGLYSRPGFSCTVARIMKRRSRHRYIDHYGEHGVILGPELDREAYRQLRTLLISLFSPLLFFAPDIHCTALQVVWYNGVTKADWSAFIQKLSTEWQEFVINATVLLNANIAFLAIQSIDNSSVNKGRSPAQIASYVSTIVSIGSISLGLLLLQKNRYKNRVYEESSSNFLGIRLEQSRLHLETLAIMYSLPWALLMWAMIFFLAAFCFMCFTASSLSVRMIVGSALLAIGILIFWYLTISREPYELRWYVQAHAHLVKVWNQLPRGLSAHLPAKFNMGWTKKMPWMSSNDVEMGPMSSHTTASLDNDESTTCSHITMSASSYETALASSPPTMSSYDTASMRSHVTDVDV